MATAIDVQAPAGLTSEEAGIRIAKFGPNAAMGWIQSVVSTPRDVKFGKCIGIRQYVFMTIELRAVEATGRRFLSNA
jgi:hypothetical protein